MKIMFSRRKITFHIPTLYPNMHIEFSSFINGLLFFFLHLFFYHCITIASWLLESMASVLVGVCPFVYMFSDHLTFLVLEHWMARNLLDKYFLWKVEEEVIKQKQSKRGMSSKSEAQDKALSVIRLRWVELMFEGLVTITTMWKQAHCSWPFFCLSSV